MTAVVKRAGRWIAAVVLIVVGLALSIPGIPGPGFLVILFGLFILMPESRWLRKRYARLKRRFPRVFAPLERRRLAQRAARSRARSASPRPAASGRTRG